MASHFPSVVMPWSLLTFRTVPVATGSRRASSSRTATTLPGRVQQQVLAVGRPVGRLVVALRGVDHFRGAVGQVVEVTKLFTAGRPAVFAGWGRTAPGGPGDTREIAYAYSGATLAPAIMPEGSHRQPEALGLWGAEQSRRSFRLRAAQACQAPPTPGPFQNSRGRPFHPPERDCNPTRPFPGFSPVDDALCIAFPFRVRFSARVTSAEHYRVILTKRRRTQVLSPPSTQQHYPYRLQHNLQHHSGKTCGLA